MDSKPPLLGKQVSNKPHNDKPKFVADIEVFVNQVRGDTSITQRKLKKAMLERRNSTQLVPNKWAKISKFV